MKTWPRIDKDSVDTTLTPLTLLMSYGSCDNAAEQRKNLDNMKLSRRAVTCFWLLGGLLTNW